MHLTVDLLIEINNIITVSNNITFSKVNVKAIAFDKKVYKQRPNRI